MQLFWGLGGVLDGPQLYDSQKSWNFLKVSEKLYRTTVTATFELFDLFEEIYFHEINFNLDLFSRIRILLYFPCICFLSYRNNP